jgi:hypothetical protein
MKCKIKPFIENIKNWSKELDKAERSESCCWATLNAPIYPLTGMQQQ